MAAEREVPVLIALGSNLGDRRAQLDGAVRCLAHEALTRLGRVSRWGEYAAEGGPAGQGAYLNGVLEGWTRLAPRALLERCQAIERRFGRAREREVRWGARALDLDLLFYGERVLAEPDLVLPHPRLEERRFVLEPLSELQPERRLPRSGRTVRERVAELARCGARVS
jgi:2-amino-4-hydroxy-6-hydroxymethyldihydropteridine diphosphokinase